MNIKITYILIFFLLFVEGLCANDFRSISTVNFETYSYNGYGFELEQVFLYKNSENTTLVIKGFHNQQQNTGTNTMTDFDLNGTLGAVINFGPFYSEFSYTIMKDKDDVLSPSIYLDLTKEWADYLLMPSVKIDFDNSNVTISPNVGFKYYKNPVFHYGIKVFSSFELGSSNNGAILVDGVYLPNIPLAFRLGFSTGTLYSETVNNLAFEYSILPGLDFIINNDFKIRYNFTWNYREDSYQTLGHGLVFDIKF